MSNMHATIIPAIIPKSAAHLAESLALVAPVSRAAQVDIVDGKFAPFTSWPYHEGHSPSALAAHLENFDIELDLMVRNPEHVLTEWCALGVSRVAIHLEGVKDPGHIFDLKQTYGVTLGFSIGNDTPLSTLTQYIDRIDFVQLMGIAAIGTQGQPFDARVLERIRTLRTSFSDLTISIDGSVNKDTITELHRAGANRFVSGSAILGAEDPHAAYQELCDLIA